MKNDYMPVAHHFYGIIDREKNKDIEAVVHYFGEGNELEGSRGKIGEIVREKNGEFLPVNSGDKVRLDRIITINGKPGPAFDEYDNYANECMDCK
jgi:hypothetical protein